MIAVSVVASSLLLVLVSAVVGVHDWRVWIDSQATDGRETTR